MKRLLALSILLLAYNAQAQKVSLSIGAGGSTNGQPTDNMVYKGDQSLFNYAVTAKLTYNTVTNWQYGIVGHMHELSSTSDSTYQGFPNRYLRIDSVGGDGKKLLYSKYTIAACAFLNKNFQVGEKTGIYLGVAAGWGFARNNSLYYDENVSYVTADGGDGFCYGGQLGINQMLGNRVSFFLDIAFRQYNFEYDAGAPLVRPVEKLNYSIWALPITVGLSYDLFKIPSRLRNTYNTKTRKYN